MTNSKSKANFQGPMLTNEKNDLYSQYPIKRETQK